ncbi:glycoside hydrolase [Kouleothrix aurantiaca]|uniref:beta-mannosidase n=1 Tax=Kouleothrix aurantiaca TaxID=186479 RepID=A0A0P9D769_9CHLR|nr:glycoside hydrolase [Kouleothrix aurantiaca]
MTFPSRTTLGGEWQLLPIDAFRQGFYPLDNDAWLTQELPAHWQQHPLLERYAGKLVYRKRFTLEEAGAASSSGSQFSALGSRYWLRLNGVFYWSQPFFNGVDLGRHEGYFIPQEYDVTDWVAAENTLVVEVDCPDEHNKLGKRMITGVFSHWDCIDPTTNPGGVWLPIELISTGPARIQQVRLQTDTLGETAAGLRFRATLDTAAAADVTLRWTIAPKNFAGEVQVIEQRRALSAGPQTIAGTLEVRDPQAWWTHDLGHPSCYTITLEVLYDGAVSDAHSFTYGLRRFEMRNWVAYLNGKRFFIKGNNYAPGDTRIATMTPERYAHDLQLAVECHMNMLRVHAHVEHPAFYEAADLAGVLLWQDFPLQWLYRREILPEALRQVREMLALLGNHPAVALWCMHNEPLYALDTKDESLYAMVRAYISVFIWNWNRDVMDVQLKEAALKDDNTRPVVRASGEYSVPFFRKGTDAHFYFGWYGGVYGQLRTFERVQRFAPANLRFITEFGAQSFPNIESCAKFLDPEISKIDWEQVAARHHMQPNMFDYWLAWRTAASLADLVAMTQEYQSAINRFYIDRLRFHKYRPTGGILPFVFNDSNPAVQWSIIDYWRVPKRSYYAMQAAFSPQYAFTLLQRDRYPIGQSVDLPVYVVNDEHRPVPLTLLAVLHGPHGEVARAERALTLPPDSMAIEIDRLRLTPDTPGDYRLELTLANTAGVLLENNYTITVGLS